MAAYSVVERNRHERDVLFTSRDCYLAERSQNRQSISINLHRRAGVYTLIQTAKYQVSWQFVSIKSRKPMHVLGVEAAVVGVASVATASAAHASTSQQAPATARIVIVPRGRDENSPARRSAIRPRFFAPLTAGQARQSRCPR